MASGDTLLTFFPNDNEPPSAAYATLDTRNGHPCLDFDAGVTEFAIFTGILPRHYGGGGVTVTLIWAATSATAEQARWDVEFEALAENAQDIDSDGFAAAQSVTDTTDGQTGELNYVEVPFTDGAQMDSVAAGQAFRLRVSRDHDHADDDMTGDAELIGIEIRET